MPLLSPMLVNKGCFVRVILSKDANLDSQNGTSLVRLPCLQSNSLARLLAEQAYVPYWSRGSDAFISLDCAFPFTPLFAKRKIAVIHDIHVVRSCHDPEAYPEDYSAQYRLWARAAVERAIEAADVIIAVSHFTAEEIREVFNIGLGKLRVVHNGLDHARFSARAGGPARDELRRKYNLPKDFYLFVGPYSRKKNLRLIVEAYALQKGRGTGVLPLVVVGDPRRSALYAETTFLIEQSGLSHLFFFLGMVPDSDLPELYASARALIYPSLYEGFGFPPLEAMACGTGVIASNAASLPEVLGKAALIVDPKNPESLLEALRQISEDSVRDKLVQAGRIQAERFSWEATATKLAEIITGN